MKSLLRKNLIPSTSLRAAPKKAQPVAASNFILNILKEGKDPVT